jgi:predicted nucleotidyltransferase
MVEKSNALTNTLVEYYKSVQHQYPLKKMLLYGSYSKGTMQTDSDIDIAVVMDRVPGKTRIDIMTQLFLLAGNINADIEPQCIFWDEFINPGPASILSEIIRTGKEIEV